MAIQHTKNFGVYHWDTFDNETILIGEADTFEDAEQIVMSEYKTRISPKGADQVEIVNQVGDVIKNYPVA